MSKSRGILTALIVGLFLVAFISGTALAQAKPPASFGAVDVEKAFDNYGRKQQLDQDLRLFADQLTQKFELRKANRLLTAEEFTQLADLKAKPSPTDAEKKKADELLNTAKQREQELVTLQQKTDATDVDKARLKELMEMGGKSDQSLREEAATYQTDITNRQIELSRKVMDDIEAAVAAVAKDKGLSLVFNKSIGESMLVIYSSVDITEDVLKKLNK